MFHVLETNSQNAMFRRVIPLRNLLVILEEFLGQIKMSTELEKSISMTVKINY